jgi:hypothetical protein
MHNLRGILIRCTYIYLHVGVGVGGKAEVADEEVVGVEEKVFIHICWTSSLIVYVISIHVGNYAVVHM